MAQVTVIIPQFYKRIIYSVFALAWCSGITFFVLKEWFQVEGEFGLENHPFQFTSLQIHGAAAFLMMVMFGFLLGTHIPRSWKMTPKRKLGITLVGIFIFMMITAYFLYYGSDGLLRDITSYAHLAVGFSFPFMLIAHIAAGKRKKLAKKQHRNWHTTR